MHPEDLKVAGGDGTGIRPKTRRLLVPRFFAAAVSGALLALSYPDFDVSWLAWFALVPLLVAVLNSTPRQGFFLCLVFSFILFSGVCRWIFEVNSYSFLHHLIVNLILGLPLGFFGWATAFLATRRGIIFAGLSAPFLWVSLEYGRSNLSFLSVPWALLSHSQSQNLHLIQVSAITGVYGISFMILLLNAALSLVLLATVPRFRPGSKPAIFPLSPKSTLLVFLTTLFLLACTLYYGKIQLSRPMPGKAFRLSLIQGNIEQKIKWDRRYRNYILDRYEYLSRQASRERPDLIIWPEAATPGLVLKDLGLYTRVTGFIREINSFSLIGSSDYPKFYKSPIKFGQIGNSALFFSPEGRLLGQYLKIHLVPFAEYVPYENRIPWPRFILPPGKMGFEVPGKKIVLFDLQGARFGTLICWESIFPDLFRRFVKEGAQFMVNITNEGWFQKPVIFRQYLAMNVFRAVENRVFLARCANTGISCIIDPHGRIVGIIKDEKGREIYILGVLTSSVTAAEEKTIYTKWGDWFAFLCIGSSIPALILSVRRGRLR